MKKSIIYLFVTLSISCSIPQNKPTQPSVQQHIAPDSSTYSNFTYESTHPAIDTIH